MKATRITEITVETDEVYVIRRRPEPPKAFCAECVSEVQMVTPERAIFITGMTWREIARRVEAGRAHFTEMNDGRLLICINSLSR